MAQHRSSVEAAWGKERMMTAPVTASERDLRALAAVVTEDRPDLPAGEGLPPSLLDDLLGLIPGDCLTVMGLDSGRQENWFGYDFPVEDDFDIVGDASPEEFWDNYWASDSCCYPDRTGDLRSVTKISDFYSARQWHSTGMYRDTIRPAGFEHQLALCLPPGPRRIAGPGQTVRLLFTHRRSHPRIPRPRHYVSTEADCGSAPDQYSRRSSSRGPLPLEARERGSSYVSPRAFTYF